LKTYVIHVDGNAPRKNFISGQLAALGLEAEYILDGNVETLRQDFIERYFKGHMLAKKPATSCASKHLMAYERIAAQGGAGFSLVLEDDALFYPGAAELLERIQTEASERALTCALISVEDSNLKYVPRSQRVADRLLYPKRRGRLAGAYLLDAQGARAILEHAAEVRLGAQMDWFHNTCVDAGRISLYWSHPVVACQAGNSGQLPSILDGRKNGFSRRYVFQIERAYKRLLYNLR
jgi:glycosyl transferase, family 25